MSKKWLQFWVITAVVLAMLILFFNSCGKKESVIKVGAMMPLTGDAAVWGQSMKQGFDLAVEEINSKGGVLGKKIQLLYEDDQCKPDQGVSVAQKMANVDKVPVIVGTCCSNVALAVIPILEKAKVVLISPGSSSPKLTGAGQYFFRNWPSDLLEALFTGEFAYNRLNFQKLAILYVNNEYGLGLKDNFKKRFQELGGSIVDEESYEQEATDYRTQLTKIKAKNPDAIYLPGYPRELARICVQAKEMKIKSQLLSCSAFKEPEIIKTAGNAAEGVLFADASYDPNDPDPNVQAFVKSYKAKYNAEPPIFVATSYDALMMVAKSIEEGGTSGEGIKNAMAKIKDFPGVSGKTTIDENHDVIKESRMSMVKNGKFVPYPGK